MENIWPAAPYNYPGSFWSCNFWFIMGEPETPHFYDFKIFGRVPGSQNQYYLSFETPGDPTTIKKNPWDLNKCFYKYQSCGNPTCWQFSKRRASENPADPSNKILEILDMGSLSIKSMEWICGKSLKLWNQETKKQKTKKPGNQQTQIKKPRNKQPRNWEAEKPKTQKSRNQETKKPRHTKKAWLFLVFLGMSCWNRR